MVLKPRKRILSVQVSDNISRLVKIADDMEPDIGAAAASLLHMRRRCVALVKPWVHNCGDKAMSNVLLSRL